MAVQQPQPQPAPQEPQPPGRSRVAALAWGIAIVALIIVASTGSAFLAYLMFNRSVPAAPQPRAVETPPVAVRSQEAKGAEAAGVAPLGPTMDAGEFVVNLAPSQGSLAVRYARVGVVVEGDRREVVDELTRRQPQVRDAIISVIRAKRFEELASAEGVEAVRRELVEALQRLVSRGRVVNVYFTELVIQ